MNTFFRKPFILITLILLVAFVVRLHEFSSPLGDWHSWRQADTSAVSRNYAKNGIDLLHPVFDDLSNVPSKLDNPHGYRFVEFPIYNVFQAGLYSLFGVFTIEECGRLVSIGSSLIATGLLYLLVLKYRDRQTALLTAFFYAFIPFNIYYGRTILPDQSMVAAILAGLYFFDRWQEDNSFFKMKKIQVSSVLYFLLALVCTAAAFLLKPYALLFTLPMVYIIWKKYGLRTITQWQLWVFLIVSVTPLLLWRQWIMQYPEGIPASDWLLNGNGIRFRPAFFRWMAYERVTKLISGYFGTLFLIVGTYYAFRVKHTGLFLSFLVSSLLYVCVFASGNVQHDYYQILIMPTIAIFAALGAVGICSFFQNRNRYVGIAIVAGITVLSFSFSWHIVRDYFNINNRDMISVGEIVDRETPTDAKIVALYNGDTSFLYQTKRQGWANMQDPLPVLIQKGADYIVLLHPSPEDVTYYSAGHQVVSSSTAYVLIKLR